MIAVSRRDSEVVCDRNSSLIYLMGLDLRWRPYITRFLGLPEDTRSGRLGLSWDWDSVGRECGLGFGNPERSPGEVNVQTHAIGEPGAKRWDERGKYRLHEALNAKSESLHFILKVTLGQWRALRRMRIYSKPCYRRITQAVPGHFGYQALT